MPFRLCDGFMGAFDWIVIPFTYGDVNKAQATEILTYGDVSGNNTPSVDQEEDKPLIRPVSVQPRTTTYNGLIASIDLLVVLVTLSSAISLSPFLVSNERRNEYLDNTVAEGLLTIFMVIGLVTMCLFVAFQDRLLENNSSRICRGSDRILFVCGLVMFYVFGCVLDLFHIIAAFGCDAVWRFCQSDIYEAYVIDMIFHFTRILYLGGSALFTIGFYSAKFSNLCVVRYGLMIMFASNVALWFDILLHESMHRSDAESWDRFSSNLTNSCLHGLNATLTRPEMIRTQNTTQTCINHDTPLYRILNHNIVPYCYPFIYECTILVGERLLHWFFSCRDLMRGAPHESLTESTTTVAVTESSGVRRMDSQMTSVNTYLSDEEPPSDDENGDDIQQSSSNRARTTNASHPVLWTVFFLATISLNILFFLLSFLPSVYSSIDVKATFIATIYINYTIFYYIMMICTTTFGYLAARHLRVRTSEPFVGLDYLLILSSIGPFGYNVFALVAIGFSDPAESGVASIMSVPLDVALNIFNIVEVYYQIPFCFFAGRVVAADDDGRPSPRSTYFKVILLHLAVCNATLWLVNSFASPFNSQKLYIQSEFFGKKNWQLLNNFLLPLTLFFRFNSFLLIAKAMRKAFKRNTDNRLGWIIPMPQ